MFYPPNHPFVHRVFHDLFWGTFIFGNIQMGALLEKIKLDANLWYFFEGFSRKIVHEVWVGNIP